MLLNQISIDQRKTIKQPALWLRLALSILFHLVVEFRSTFVSIVLGLGYTQILEFLFAGHFYSAGWLNWQFTIAHFSASLLLNPIGNRVPEIPTSILAPLPALATATIYTLVLLATAIWLCLKQDVGVRVGMTPHPTG